MKHLLTILVLLALVSCKTKQKTVGREKINTQLESVNDIEETTVETLEAATFETADSFSTTITDNSIEEIEADSTGTVTVKIEKTDTGIVKTFTGVKKIKLTNEKKEATVDESKTLTTAIDATKTTTKSDESSIKFKQETKTRKTDVEIKSTSTWFWLILLFLIIGFVVLKRYKLL